MFAGTELDIIEFDVRRYGTESTTPIIEYINMQRCFIVYIIIVETLKIQK